MHDDVSETQRITQPSGIVAETRGLNPRQQRRGRGEGRRKSSPAQELDNAAPEVETAPADGKAGIREHGNRIDLII